MNGQTLNFVQDHNPTPGSHAIV